MKTRAAGGLLVRRTRWGLSAAGWLAALVLLAAAGLGAARGLYPFLALTRRVPSPLLVVDGWLPTHCLAQAAAEYQKGGYTTVLAVRGVYDLDSVDLDQPVDDYVAAILVRRGVPRGRLHSVLFPGQARDRTFYSAEAIRQWCARRGRPLDSLDLATTGAHARRSLLLYRRALGPGVRLGVVALADPAFDARHWWRSSEGIREVLFEGVAYLYVRLAFIAPAHPTLQLLNTP